MVYFVNCAVYNIKNDNVISLDNGDIFEFNKVTVANDDETKTSYMFNEPIKYYDEVQLWRKYGTRS